MKFGSPTTLSLFLFLPTLAFLLWRYNQWLRKNVSFWNDNLQKDKNAQKQFFYKQTISSLFLFACFGFLFFSLAQPNWGKQQVQRKQKGVDIIVILDVSETMRLQDTEPSRWQRALQELKVFYRKLRGDRVALIAFSEEAGLQCPYTDDVTALEQLSWHSKPGIFQSSGNGFADAFKIAQEQQMHTLKKASAKLLLLVSDGQSFKTPSAQAQAYRLAKALGKKTTSYVLGVGALKKPKSLEQSDSDSRWEPLWQAQLMKIAKLLGGSYKHLDNADFGLKEIQAKLHQLRTTERNSIKRTEGIERFQIFLAIGLCFFFLHLYTRP